MAGTSAAISAKVVQIFLGEALSRRAELEDGYDRSVVSGNIWREGAEQRYAQNRLHHCRDLREKLSLARQEMRRYDAGEELDAIVIGTGAGGAPILAKLAAAGLRVLALEAGPWWESPAEDFATDEVDAVKIYWVDERLSAGDTPIVFGGNNSGTGVGGSTLHWGAFVQPLQSDLFDPEHTPILNGVKFRNSVLQRVITLLSLSRENDRTRRGRISIKIRQEFVLLEFFED